MAKSHCGFFMLRPKIRSWVFGTSAIPGGRMNGIRDGMDAKERGWR